MQLSIVAHLVQNQPLERLQAAETALMAGQMPPFDVVGADGAEQLTHVLVAQDWLLHMRRHGTGLAAARRAFAQRVRRWVGPSPNQPQL